jgi:hypothetical protein
VLRRWFGPNKEEIWRQLSEQIGGRFVDGGIWKADKVEAAHREWTVTLDTYAVSTGKAVVIFTRMRAPYVNPDAFRFTIYRKSIFTGMGKLLGMQDIDIGVEDFDREFVVKANDEGKVRQLLMHPEIRALIEGQKDIKFSVKDDEGWFGTKFPEGVDELSFVVAGIIKDIDRLKKLYDLFAATLDELCRMGSAYETDPGVKVR